MDQMYQRSNYRLIFAMLLALVTTLYTVGAVRAGDWSPDDVMNDFVGDQNRQYEQYQPPHFYPYSAPRDLLGQWYDSVVPQMVTTWTVFGYDALGPVDSCPSRGYGLPWGAQITNPMYPKKVDVSGSPDAALSMDQPDPDGLYTNSANTSATIVLCNRNGQWVFEQHEEVVTTYPIPLHLEYLADGVHQKIVFDPGNAQIVVDVTAIDGKYQAPQDINVSGQ